MWLRFFVTFYGNIVAVGMYENPAIALSPLSLRITVPLLSEESSVRIFEVTLEIEDRHWRLLLYTLPEWNIPEKWRCCSQYNSVGFDSKGSLIASYCYVCEFKSDVPEAKLWAATSGDEYF